MSDRKPSTSSEVAGSSGRHKSLDGSKIVAQVRSPERTQNQLRMRLNLPPRDSPSPDTPTATSPRRAVSPLLEVRRPICTLKCDNCTYALFHRFGLVSDQDSSKYF